MIEVPRGALTADEIAEHAEFFSFGTNDLTQMGFGYSRDDAEGKFLMQYVDRKVLPENPFQVLDVAGMGQLMRMGVEKGRATKPGLKIGICGEHGGDPQSHRLLPRDRPRLRLAARRSACRWPAWPPPRPRSPQTETRDK